MAWLGFLCTLLLAAATLAQAPPATGSPPAPAPLPAPVQKEVQLFLERYCRAAPGRQIRAELAGDAVPPGFRLVRYRLASSDPTFEYSSAVFLSSDNRSVYVGRAVRLPSLPGILGPQGPEILGRYLSGKAGAPLTANWEKTPGPAGTFVAKVRQQSPFGLVVTDGALASDGNWFLFGSFFLLASDPRAERLNRLSLKDRPSEGAPSAPVTLVDFSDYQCTSCAEVQTAIGAVMAKRPGQVRLVHVDLPQWRAHDWAFAAAEAGLCVQRVAPEAYPEFRKALFYRQQNTSAGNLDEMLLGIGEALGLPLPAWGSCRKEGRARQRILDDLGIAPALGVMGTPAVLVNGALLDWNIASVVDAEVARVLAGKK